MSEDLQVLFNKLIKPVQFNRTIGLLCATALAEKHHAKMILFSYLPPGYSRKQKTKTDKLIVQSLLMLKSTALYHVELFVHDNPIEDIIKRSPVYDALILGRDLRNPDEALEELASFQIARQAKCTVVIARRAAGIEKITQNL